MENLLDKDIKNVRIENSIERSYLDYSMSVIIGRALPDARDGLKPVHRRILYAMHSLKLNNNQKYKKSARIVGDVIGKYHPHGDTSVYDALVRMAQSFSMRAPLVDGQGNFGSIDGDNAAAMRYTEAKMEKISEELLKDIEKDTVDFVPNYDDSETEPYILPSRVPNLLLNGSEGIAVGMATKIPPHNLGELCDALLLLVDNPKVELTEIMEHVKGPDFPTSATIHGKKGILDAYKTGRGSIKIRAKLHTEQIGSKEVIIIDELPYQVNKSRLIENIADLVKSKEIKDISEIRDESDKDGIRVVIELKRGAITDIVINHLYKRTSMQISYGIILLAVYNNEPKVFTLIELLSLFLKHRKTVIIRRTIFDLEKARHRAHILEGYIKANENIEEIVNLIKASKDAKSAKEELMSKYELSLVQAEKILEMRLQTLTGLARDKIEEEHKQKLEEIKELESILRDEDKLNTLIKDELIELKTKFATPRKTEIENSLDSFDDEDLIPNEAMVITITHNGYIKRVNLKSYEQQKRGGKGKTAVTTHDDDFIESFFVANAHDTLMFITNAGQLYWLKVYKIPEGSRTSKGKFVTNLIELKEDEKIMSIIPTNDFDESKSLAFFTKQGITKRTNLKDFSNVRSNGVRAIVLDDNDELVTAKVTDSETSFMFMITNNGMCVRFNVDDVRQMGRNARGVRGITFKNENDYVVDANTLRNEEEELLIITQKGIGKRTEAKEYRLTKRAGKGVIAIKTDPAKTGSAVASVIVDKDMDLMVLTSKEKMIRVEMTSIKKASRNTYGVKIVNVDNKDKVISMARCAKEEADPIILDEENSSETVDNNSKDTNNNDKKASTLI
jgi:DNA gyrase subunit A